MGRKAFTLLEVLLAITILATLMAFTAQSIIRSSRDKVRLQGEIDRDSKLTNALRLVERDINMAFHQRQFITEVEKAVKAESRKQNPQPPNPNPNPPMDPDPSKKAGNPQQNSMADFEPKEYPQLTQFLGTENSLHFTSLSHVRTLKDSPESDQQEVGYYLEPCEKKEDKSGSQCLWRRTNPYIDEDISKGGHPVLLLPGVKELKFRYYSNEKLDWVSAWRTDRGGDDATRDKFPLAVEITLSILEKDKESSVATVVPILFPNNKDKKDNAAAATPGQPPAPNPGGPPSQ